MTVVSKNICVKLGLKNISYLPFFKNENKNKIEEFFFIIKALSLNKNVLF